jgi:hypothetical protein
MHSNTLHQENIGEPAGDDTFTRLTAPCSVPSKASVARSGPAAGALAGT